VGLSYVFPSLELATNEMYASSMSVERDIRFHLIARLCPNTTGAELRSVATEVRLEFSAPCDSTTTKYITQGWDVRYSCTTESRNGA
jgi:hypothetical protein